MWGVELLGVALVRCSGLGSYEELVTGRISKPLGMVETSLTLDEVMRERVAEGDTSAGAWASNWELTSMVWAGGLRSSVNDMKKCVSFFA
jgi:CubicO group peptidase (beta-lactamase class C family)